MSGNSELIPVEDNIQDCPASSPDVPVRDYHNPVLLRESALSRLYRVSCAGKHFIIKTPKDQQYSSLIRREYDLSAGLSHPYIINVFTFEQHTPVGEGIVMEYVDGRNLREFLAEKPSWQLRKRVLDQLLMAVSYLHSKGVVHNDLKPENVLVTHQDNSVKLIDFGLSDTDAQYLYRTLGCSPEYASPELLARQKTDSRSDIYSLGLLVRDILGNRAIRIVARCLSRNPSCRYPNVDHLRKALARRHYPIYFAVAAACAIVIAIAIGQFSKRMEDLRNISLSGTQMQEHLDSVYALMSKEQDAKATNEVVVVKDAGFQEYKADKDRAREICDSVCNDIKFVVDKAMSDYLDRINGVPYCEFVLKEYEALHDVLVNYKKTWANVFADPSINDHLERYFTRIYSDYLKLESVNPDLPYFNYSSLPEDEKAFYQSLLDNNEPYRPYEK